MYRPRSFPAFPYLTITTAAEVSPLRSVGTGFNDVADNTASRVTKKAEHKNEQRVARCRTYSCTYLYDEQLASPIDITERPMVGHRASVEGVDAP